LDGIGGSGILFFFAMYLSLLLRYISSFV